MLSNFQMPNSALVPVAEGEKKSNKTLLVALGITPVAFSLLLFSTTNTEQGSKSVIQAIADAFIKSGPLGIVALVFIITTFISAYLAWKAKQDQISFMQEVINTNREENKENRNFAETQTEAFKNLSVSVDDCTDQLAELIKAFSVSEKRIAKRIDTLAISDSNIDKDLYLQRRGDE